MDQDQAVKVETQVIGLTGDKQMFTAFDVTRRLRAKGEDVRHYDVKSVVHDCFARGQMGMDYDRTVRNVAGGSPFIYHPDTKDPEAYDPHELGSSVQAPPAIPDAVNTPSSVVTTNVSAPIHVSTFDVSRNARGRVRITSQYLKKIGVHAGDAVFCYPVGKVIRISSDRISGLHDETLYFADEYGNIRLNSRFLDKVFSVNDFKIHIQDNAMPPFVDLQDLTS
jgi:hypothetical protein